jgi:DNA (cytosine-5)-methyltransferase 1
MNFYNEIDPKAAAWLRELMAGGHIPSGVVDERSITEISPDELSEYTQCHFFAGIGGWSLALRLAGWPDDAPVWTGSCPCQPFSCAGQGKGHADERHLWPAFYHLIAEREPSVVFGEQVAGKVGYEWLAGVRADLEASGYAVGAADLCAASVGAPHIRQRLYWVADATKRQRSQLSYDESQGHESRFTDSSALRVVNAVRAGWEGSFDVSSGEQSSEREPRYKRIVGADGKARRVPVEPELYPLAYGLPGRVGLLRGYGNAIVPQVAREFVMAFSDIHTPNAGGMARELAAQDSNNSKTPQP